MIASAPQLKLIQKLGVGVNTIDLEAAKARRGRGRQHARRNSQAVAEMTLALMLAVLRRVVSLNTLTRAGEGWSPAPGLADTFGEIAGRTVGFVGYGAARHAVGRARCESRRAGRSTPPWSQARAWRDLPGARRLARGG